MNPVMMSLKNFIAVASGTYLLFLRKLNLYMHMSLLFEITVSAELLHDVVVVLALNHVQELHDVRTLEFIQDLYLSQQACS
jgi:hypothetical protein